jgi:hypothetical protein
MNQNILVAGVVVLAVIVAGWWLMSAGPQGGSQSPNAEETKDGEAMDSTAKDEAPAPVKTAPAKTDIELTKNTYVSIFNQSGSHECLYESVDGSTRKHNRIYIADGKMRGEFRTVGQVGTLMVYNGGYLYTWKEGTTIGTKSLISTLADLPELIPQDLTSKIIFGKSGSNNASWDCHPWIKDGSMLSVPSYVKF